MKDLNTYLINEGWGNQKNYKEELQKIMDDYGKRLERKKAGKLKNGPGSYLQNNSIYKAFAKYPYSILADKAGYVPKFFKQNYYSSPKGGLKQKDVINVEEYGDYIIHALEAGKFTIEDMIKWWDEYDTNILKEKYHDPSYLIKLLDPTTLYDPYHPTSDWKINKIINNPSELIVHLRNRSALKISRDEYQELVTYFTDPANAENLKEAFTKAKKKIEAMRPKFSKSAGLWLKEIIADVEYSGGNLADLLDEEDTQSRQKYSQGANERSTEGTAILGVIIKAINQYYKIDMDTYTEYNEDWTAKSRSYKSNKHEEDPEDPYQKFCEDASKGLKIKVTNLGESEKKSKSKTSVWASSFTTSYNYDIEVKLILHGEEVFKKTFKNITLGTYFYSGGWD